MRTHRKGGCYGRPLSPPILFKMELQIPCRVHPEATAEGAVWKCAPSTRGGLPYLGPAERMPDSRRHLTLDHVPICIAIPPKHSVIGFLKGKSAIAVARLSGKERNFTGEHFWARGYAVSTVGFELEQ